MRGSRRQLSVIQQSSLCVSVTIRVLWVLFTFLSSVTQASAPAYRKQVLRQIRAKADRVIDCVPPCLRCFTSGDTNSLWLSREPTVHIVSGCHYVRFAPGKLSSRKEPSPAFLTVLAPLQPRWSGSTLGVCNWIWRREWRRASPYLLPHLPDPLPALWDRKPVLRSLPPRLGASPIFIRGGWCGERWVFGPSIPTVWGAIRGSYSCGCQVEHRLAHRETGSTAEE